MRARRRMRYGPSRRGLLPTCLLALAALVSLPMAAVPALASPSIAQSGGSSCTANPCSSASITTTSAITVNNVLAVSVETLVPDSTACSTQSTISDTAGNKWTAQETISAAPPGLNQCVYSAIDSAPITNGGFDTIIVTVGGPAYWIGIQYQELAGVSTSGVVQSAGTDHETSCTPLGPFLTSYSLTSQSFSPGSVLIGAYSTDFQVVYGPPAAGGTYTTQVTNPPYEAFDEYSTTAPSPNTWPASNSGGVCLWAGVGVAFAPAVPPRPVPQFPLGLSLLLVLALPVMVLLRSRERRSIAT